MSNPLKPASLGWARGPIVDSQGIPTREFMEWITRAVAPASQVIHPSGEIHVEAPVRGRAEGLGTTVQNLTASGQMNSTDNVIDGPGTPLTGGKRGAIALDANNQISSTFRMNPVNVSATPLLSVGLTNNGIETPILVGEQTFQFASGKRSYNSASIDPGVFGTVFVYADDPTFAGGNVNYQFSTNSGDQTAAEGRIPFGKIITLLGTAKSGGGSSGGTTAGGEGGRGFAPDLP